MNPVFGSVLTGEPLEWQLSNTQRLALGLAPVESHWVLREVPSGVLSAVETHVYLNGMRVMRVISYGSYGRDYYEECCVDVTLTEEGSIAPVKPGRKSVPLTAANLHKRRHTGVSLTFDATGYDTVIRVQDHDARRERLYVRLPQRMSSEEFAAWVSENCKEVAP